MIQNVAASASATSGSNVFSILSYNIFAKSLGSNTIPWVLQVSDPSIKSRIEKHRKQPFEQYVNDELKPEYMSHFHKNFDSGNYASMRSFWGTKTCRSGKDIPLELNGLTFIDEDLVSYKTAAGKNKQATTLRGMAKKSLPPDLSMDFFNDIVSQEEHVFQWDIRGPRIFDTIVRQHNKPSIVVLTEYDCHDVLACYSRGDNNNDHLPATCSNKGRITFADAMLAEGYAGAFLTDPLIGRDPPSGLGIFWKTDIFETRVSTNTVGSSSNNNTCIVETIECNTHGFNGAVINADLKETWHPTSKNGDGYNKDAVLMKDADRRNAGLVKLRHKPTGRTLLVCSAHLMTTSRDSAKTNAFPGEVRTDEIVKIKGLIEEHCEEDDAIIWAGDFNIDARECRKFFTGVVQENSNNREGGGKLFKFDTGYDTATDTFVWRRGTIKLKDALADLHGYGIHVGEGKRCTSKNANRVEWIDYLMSDADRLKIKETSVCETPNNSLPDERHPSDHLPIFAELQFV